jgi:DnaJ-class molecular chaperone
VITVEDYLKCPKCHGEGKYCEVHGWDKKVWYECDLCHGCGKIGEKQGDIKHE